MDTEGIALMAHLMRRAGFGASRDELEARVAKGYEATVKELLNPQADRAERYDFLRYHPGFPPSAGQDRTRAQGMASRCRL